jgi:effector-binding domain-containing protein
MEEIGPKMEADFMRLNLDLEKGSLPQPAFLFSSYRKFDFLTRDVDYVSGFGFKANPNLDITSKYETGDIPAHNAIKVTHTGAYKYVGNAWSTAMGAQMALKKRLNKAVPMYEIYESDPHEIEEKDLITSIYVPIK